MLSPVHRLQIPAFSRALPSAPTIVRGNVVKDRTLTAADFRQMLALGQPA
jgi:hypothetical protein